MKTLKNFTFRGRAGAVARYDWDAILDGEIHEMVDGEDFTAKPENFKMIARRQAKLRGLRLKTGVTQDGNVMGVHEQGAR